MSRAIIGVLNGQNTESSSVDVECDEITLGADLDRPCRVGKVLKRPATLHLSHVTTNVKCLMNLSIVFSNLVTE